MLLNGYVAMIALVPPLSAIAERLIFGRGIVGSLPLGQVFALNVFWYFMILINMAITAAVFSAVAAGNGPWWSSLRGLQLASFSFTPLFLAGIPAIIPQLNWVFYPAVLYSLYLVYLGIRTMTGAAQGKAAVFAIASSFVAALIVATLNGMEYMFESLVAKTIF
jgi:hypothetical protein